MGGSSSTPASTSSQKAPFDYCVVTASSDTQAHLYQELIQRRVHCGLYPSSLNFRVYADPPGGRVGSGGGTLVALHELYRQEVGQAAINSDGALDEDGIRKFFGFHRILLLHAGGESRRLPCYVPEGKLFGPLSLRREERSSQCCPTVVLDLLLSLYFRYPWATGEVVLASGDVIVDFDTTILRDTETSRGAICGFGKLASYEQGSRHGVFAFEQGTTGCEQPILAVRDFHQKSPVAVLRRECSTPNTEDACALDTGIFAMTVDWCLAFFRLAAEPYSSGTLLSAVEASQLYFDFYLEVVIASLPGMTREAYLSRVASQTKLQATVLEKFLTCLAGLELRGALLPNCAFLHFGTLTEFPEASLEASRQCLRPFYDEVDETLESKPVLAKDTCSSPIIVNCREARVQRNGQSDASEIAWVEMCENIDITISPTGFNMLVGLKGLSMEKPLPAGICFDGRHLSNEGVVVAVYSIKDTFKRGKRPEDTIFCGQPLSSWLSERGLEPIDVWDDTVEAAAGTELWLAKLFPEFDQEKPDSLSSYWESSLFSREDFLAAKRYSLADLNMLDSALVRDELRSTLGML